MGRRTSTPGPSAPIGGVTRYRDRIFDAKRHDPYEARGKYREPTQCPDCGAVYRDGRWQWASAAAVAQRRRCPACQRAADGLAAGQVALQGPRVSTERDALMRVIRNEAEHERTEHPLHRIMRIDESADGIDVSTTDIHLPQRIGEALERAFGGTLEIGYAHDEYGVRVRWQG